MRSASFPLSSSNERRNPLGRRATAMLFALLAHILLFLLLYFLTPPLPIAVKSDSKAFQLVPLPVPTEAPKPSTHPRLVSVKRPAGGGAPRIPRPRPANAATKTDEPPTAPMKMLIIGKEAFQAADIAGIPSHHGDPAPAGGGEGGNGAGKGEGDDDGPGSGPGGEKLYNAQWYTEPTHAEMATYLPHRAVTGWGMIACRTIERYHVDQCREIGESPGSGLARTLREAAWQFKVLPPRIGGHPMVGAWVRIRFDFTTYTDKAPSP